MYSFYIDGDDIKKFMNFFLKEDKFDKFEVRSCELVTNVSYDIDCKLNKDWYDTPPERDYCTWQELRPMVFELIKGKKKPKSMKFVLAVSKKANEKIHNNALACFLNIVFESDKVIVSTGTAQKEFSLDKSLELIWGEKIRERFEKLEITQNLI